MLLSVTILWGSTPEPDDTPVTYEFPTQAEMDAFMAGVEAANGWLDYEIIEGEETDDD